MPTKPTNVNSLQVGGYMMMENVPCRIVNIDISKSGKHGHKKARITSVGLVDEKKRVDVFPSGDNIDVPIVEKRNAQVLSITGDNVNVMDSETFETFDLKIPDEFKGQIVENASVFYWDILGEKVIKQVRDSGDGGV